MTAPLTAAGIAQDLQRLDAMRLFMAILPEFMRRTGKRPVLVFEGVASPEGAGVGCNVGFAGAEEEEWPGLFSRLMADFVDAERLQRLQLLIDELRNLGHPPEQIGPMVKEADALAARLHPRDPPPDGVVASG